MDEFIVVTTRNLKFSWTAGLDITRSLSRRILEIFFRKWFLVFNKSKENQNRFKLSDIKSRDVLWKSFQSWPLWSLYESDKLRRWQKKKREISSKCRALVCSSRVCFDSKIVFWFRGIYFKENLIELSIALTLDKYCGKNKNVICAWLIPSSHLISSAVIAIKTHCCWEKSSCWNNKLPGNGTGEGEIINIGRRLWENSVQVRTVHREISHVFITVARKT